MKEENVARVGFAARRTAEQQRHFTVRDRVLGEIVVHDEDVFAFVHQLLADRAAGVRSEILEGRRLGGTYRDDRGVLERAALRQDLGERGDRRVLLADRDVDAVDVAALLVDDRVDRDGGLAGAAVADDQLALAFADRDQRVDGADTGLERLLNALALNHGRGDVFDRAILVRFDRTFAVDRIAERIDDAAEQRMPDRDRDDAPGALDLLAFFDLRIGAEDDDADVVLFEIEDDALHAVFELDQFRLLNGFEAIDARDARADFDHGADLVFVHFAREVSDLILEDSGDFVGVDHGVTFLRRSS